MLGVHTDKNDFNFMEAFKFHTNYKRAKID